MEKGEGRREKGETLHLSIEKLSFLFSPFS
jgi:hypothetical protein